MATVDEDGMPHVVPMWYVILDGDIYIETTGTTKKVRNVESNKKTPLIVDAGDSVYDYRGVMIQGRMELVEDKALFKRFREAYAQRYFGSDEHPGYKLLTGIPNRVLLKFIPEKSASWDYRKWKF
ncbi:MAG: pyridoxamine 5'-phosphate oxidase family protein [Deltaproteobacteria bacterium]|nr:pyridoxamine 5'-phosphate oxidase family protein [Deltaproteobacteria bacterium]